MIKSVKFQEEFKELLALDLQNGTFYRDKFDDIQLCVATCRLLVQ